MNNFSHLMSPVKIGSMTARNRIAMAPMGTSFWSQDGLLTERAKAYYEARARGGAGIIIIENAAVDFYTGMHVSNRPAIDSDLTLPGLAEMAKAIQKHGAKAVVQINHTGRVAKSRLSGIQPVAPTGIPYPGGRSAPGEVPRELAKEEIHGIVGMFARAVERAKKAGFDGVEIHGAHQYLIAEFLSPFSNKRQDEYGGNVKNRARILVEILTESRKLVGRDFPLWCRMNGAERGIDDGLTLDDARAIAGMVSGLVDAFSISGYGYGKHSLIVTTDIPGELLPLAAAIKQVASVPVFAAGRISPELGDQAIKEGKADLIAMGRPLIADEDMPNKISAGCRDDVRPCIACYYCQDTGSVMNSPISCSVNAVASRETELVIRPAAKAKRVAIIGGGPAGMEAARVLALRGHAPVIIEKDSRLGGQLNLARVAPHKEERMGPLVAWFLKQLKDLKVDIRLDTEASVDLIRDMKPDSVILAAGIVPLVPPVPGAQSGSVVTALDILSGRAKAGKQVVVVGGGAVGCETAEFLYEQGKEVTVVEMIADLAVDLGARDRFRLLSRLKTLPINMMTGARCGRITPDGVVISSKDGVEKVVAAETVVMATGVRPNNSLYPALRAAGLEPRMAGDCWHPGRIVNAVSDGFRIGSVI